MTWMTPLIQSYLPSIKKHIWGQTLTGDDVDDSLRVTYLVWIGGVGGQILTGDDTDNSLIIPLQSYLPCMNWRCRRPDPDWKWHGWRRYYFPSAPGRTGWEYCRLLSRSVSECYTVPTKQRIHYDYYDMQIFSVPYTTHGKNFTFIYFSPFKCEFKTR